jgi:hypothetical protein
MWKDLPMVLLAFIMEPKHKIRISAKWYVTIINNTDTVFSYKDSQKHK